MAENDNKTVEFTEEYIVAVSGVIDKDLAELNAIPFDELKTMVEAHARAQVEKDKPKEAQSKTDEANELIASVERAQVVQNPPTAYIPLTEIAGITKKSNNEIINIIRTGGLDLFVEIQPPLARMRESLPHGVVTYGRWYVEVDPDLSQQPANMTVFRSASIKGLLSRIYNKFFPSPDIHHVDGYTDTAPIWMEGLYKLPIKANPSFRHDWYIDALYVPRDPFNKDSPLELAELADPLAVPLYLIVVLEKDVLGLIPPEEVTSEVRQRVEEQREERKEPEAHAMLDNWKRLRILEQAIEEGILKKDGDGLTRQQILSALREYEQTLRKRNPNLTGKLLFANETGDYRRFWTLVLDEDTIGRRGKGAPTKQPRDTPQ
jgi:hypothetical protein